MKRIVGGCLMVAILPVAGLARPLSFDDAIETASANAPTNEAGRLRTSAARSSAQAAGALPDPRLSVGVENFPISGPPAFSLSEDEMTMVRVGVEQEVPNPSKRRAARRLAQAEIGVAEAESASRARQVRLGAALAWVDLAYAERRLAVIERILEELGPLAKSVNASVAFGTARPAEALGAAQAIANIENRRTEMAANAARARAMLTRWTGESSPQIAGDPPELALDPVRLRTQIQSHPALRAADAASRRADASVDAARAEKRPDFGFELAYGRRDPSFGDMISAGFSVSLPLFARNRQDPLIAARAADAARVLAEREDARRNLQAELEAGLADHVMHHEQWVRARDTLLSLARQRVQLETASYEAGRATLVEAVEAHSMLAEAELTALDREAEVVRDAVRLTISFGRDPQ
jgi:cobalt-zinc-cadmium efflux system outer membrane protein